MIVKNTFDIFGCADPFEVNSLSEIAMDIINALFDKFDDGRYVITPPRWDATGSANETEWVERVYQAADDVFPEDEAQAKQGEIVELDRAMSEDKLIEFVIEAIEVVEEVKQ